MENDDILHIVFSPRAKAQTEFVQIYKIHNIMNLAEVPQNVIIMKEGMIKMDKFYKLLIMFEVGKPCTEKRLLKIPGITHELIQEAIDSGYITQTSSSDIGEIRYLITPKGREKR